MFDQKNGKNRKNRKNRKQLTILVSLIIMGLVPFLLSSLLLANTLFDGQYSGNFSGDASGSISFTVTGGSVSGSISGSYLGNSISGEFSGNVSADGTMITQLSGTIWADFTWEDIDYSNESFSGTIRGNLFPGGYYSGDPPRQFPALASGSWNASTILGSASGSWEASGTGTPVSPDEKLPVEDDEFAPPPTDTTMLDEKPETTEPEFTWDDYADWYEGLDQDGQEAERARLKAGGQEDALDQLDQILAERAAELPPPDEVTDAPPTRRSNGYPPTR